MLRSDISGILVAKRYAEYKDQPGRLYHYPTGFYQSAITRLKGQLVLIYEPRRGGSTRGSSGGGRMAFVGYAFLGDSWADGADPTHSFVETRHFTEFPAPVSLASTAFNAKALQRAVHVIPAEAAEKVLALGLAPILSPKGTGVQEGLVDPSVPPELTRRPIRDVIVSRPVRDASFRMRVVADVYQGVCALSGVKLTNGYGRAEVDAAHIMPVERGGPDSVQNGLALSKTLHWAFDRGLISLADDGAILTVERGLDSPLRRLIRPEGHSIQPTRPDDRPHPWFVAWHRGNVFKGTHT